MDVKKVSEEVRLKQWMEIVKECRGSGTAYSMIESAKANRLDLYKYLTYIFKYLRSKYLVKNLEVINEFFPW